jgi:hypothetical protein
MEEIALAILESNMMLRLWEQAHIQARIDSSCTNISHAFVMKVGMSDVITILPFSAQMTFLRLVMGIVRSPKSLITSISSCFFLQNSSIICCSDKDNDVLGDVRMLIG